MPLNLPERDGSQVLWDSYFSLQDPTNKAGGGKATGEVGEFSQELTLDISDDELLRRKERWERRSKPYTERIATKQKLNKKYYLGESYGSVFDPRKALDGEGGIPQADNLLFESVETYIPEITKQEPEPVVKADESENGTKFAEMMKDILVFKADELSLRLKMKVVARFWSLLYLGPLEVGWDDKTDDMCIDPLNTQKMIFDPSGAVEFGEYKGEYIGIPKEKTAKQVMELFPEKAEQVKELVEGNLGTMVRYVEWYTNDMVFWTLKDIVLGKFANPFFNREPVVKESVDPMGQVTMAERPPLNHFTEPKMPFAFLSVFTMLTQPHDITGLVEQNLSNQDRLNKFIRQIDKNADMMNGGWGVSGDAFTEEEAANAVMALQRANGVVWVPRGPIESSIKKFQGQGLPADVYQQVGDIRQEIRGIFGTTGFTAQGIKNEDTVRGKILVSGRDQGRSAGVSDFVEQTYDVLFNWMVQLVITRYEEKHLVPILGEDRTALFLQLRDAGYKLLVSVKEGSLIPKDALTRRNEAVDLWAQGAIDPFTFFERIDDPDPKQSTERLLLYKANPQLYAQSFGIPLAVPPPEAGGVAGEGQIAPAETSPEAAAIEQGQDLLTAVPIQ